MYLYHVKGFLVTPVTVPNDRFYYLQHTYLGRKQTGPSFSAKTPPDCGNTPV